MMGCYAICHQVTLNVTFFDKYCHFWHSQQTGRTADFKEPIRKQNETFEWESRNLFISVKRHKLNIFLKIAEVNEADKMKWKYEQSLSKKAAVIDNMKHEFNKLLINFNNIDDATRLREIMEDPALETKVRFFLFQTNFSHCIYLHKTFQFHKRKKLEEKLIKQSIQIWDFKIILGIRGFSCLFQNKPEIQN